MEFDEWVNEFEMLNICHLYPDGLTDEIAQDQVSIINHTSHTISNNNSLNPACIYQLIRHEIRTICDFSYAVTQTSSYYPEL